MENRVRPVQIKFRVTEQEYDVIKQRMKLIGAVSMAQYMRKISMDGFLYKVDISPISNMAQEVSGISRNINQMAKRVNETGKIYEQDFAELRANQQKIFGIVKQIFRRLP